MLKTSTRRDVPAYIRSAYAIQLQELRHMAHYKFVHLLRREADSCYGNVGMHDLATIEHTRLDCKLTKNDYLLRRSNSQTKTSHVETQSGRPKHLQKVDRWTHQHATDGYIRIHLVLRPCACSMQGLSLHYLSGGDITYYTRKAFILTKRSFSGSVAHLTNERYRGNVAESLFYHQFTCNRPTDILTINYSLEGIIRVVVEYIELEHF